MTQQYIHIIFTLERPADSPWKHLFKDCPQQDQKFLSVVFDQFFVLDRLLKSRIEFKRAVKLTQRLEKQIPALDQMYDTQIVPYIRVFRVLLQ